MEIIVSLIVIYLLPKAFKLIWECMFPRNNSYRDDR